MWLYALVSLTISGASAYPVMLTGHAAEDVMKDKWYVTRDAIHEHEEAGDEKGVPPVWLGALVVLMSLAGAGTTTIAAYRGGNIVYYSPKLASPPRRSNAARPRSAY